jgi:arabinose-5-phosphate isomerase
MPKKSPSYIAQKTISIQQEALGTLSQNLNHEFDTACELLLSCQGRIIVIGMGKSGHIGRKISATLASTGSPAFYIHPAEACHGDMGMICSDDVVLAISYSGETEELLNTLPAIKQVGAPIIALTSSRTSTLSQAAVFTLLTAVTQEACPHNLAPTSSTTATLVLGDAIAVALLEMRGFSAEDFARCHPGGSLGKQLLLQVGDLMHRDQQIPLIHCGSTLQQALVEVSSKRLGLTTVVDSNGKLCGIFTDGDLRRSMESGSDIYETIVDDLMTLNPRSISPVTQATEALTLMRKHKITSLVVLENEQVVGVIHIHDLLHAGISIQEETSNEPHKTVAA